ncbi:ABC transporter ATP-binding protein [Suttonella ornithocola]|uniref:Lipopolysaccharide export system ATP-binding protein LptB n=1 Tax=Suttonella ornithocola TaxID=279832 RepID=A0A380MLF4_9GAMM|nr:ABC transporter ATP-binding protein [Suttonella ornithocola]SUO92994.1 Lipopolysaccharide export system ATP-binding protein LptB [Suttonella ornithocola]
MVTTPLLQLKNISFACYKKTIINNASLSLHQGEIIALIGDNGAGKTSLLSIAAGLIPPHAGEVIYYCVSPKIAWMTDQATFFPNWTVAMLLNWYTELTHPTIKEEEKNAIIQQCHLESVLHQSCKTLSHGYRQRLSLAKALLQQPDILLLDEPSNGLDTKHRSILYHILKRCAKQGMGIIVIEHQWQRALQISNKIYDIYQGQVYKLPLPSKKEYWLWAEWQTQSDFPKTIPANKVLDYHTGYCCYTEKERTEKMMQLSIQPGVIALTTTPPSALLQNIRNKHHDA